MLGLAMLASSFALASCGGGGPAEPFKVGSDTATKTVEGSSEWATKASAYVRIYVVAEKKELFNGKVTVTGDDRYASDYVIAACEKKALANDGVAAGFITKIGEYSSNDTTATYWGWTYNGHVTSDTDCGTMFAVNQIHIFEGDYIDITYDVMTW